jgi:hypothetical protein
LAFQEEREEEREEEGRRGEEGRGEEEIRIRMGIG